METHAESNGSKNGIYRLWSEGDGIRDSGREEGGAGAEGAGEDECLKDASVEVDKVGEE